MLSFIQKNKGVISTVLSVLVFLSCFGLCFADETAATPSYVNSTWNTVSQVLEFVLWFVAIGGAVFIGWGVYQLVSGFRNEDPDLKNKGTMQLIVGALMIALRIFLIPILKGILGI